jgi:hypothetical protein
MPLSNCCCHARWQHPLSGTEGRFKLLPQRTSIASHHEGRRFILRIAHQRIAAVTYGGHQHRLGTRHAWPDTAFYAGWCSLAVARRSVKKAAGVRWYACHPLLTRFRLCLAWTAPTPGCSETGTDIRGCPWSHRRRTARRWGLGEVKWCEITAKERDRRGSGAEVGQRRQ